MLGGQRGTVTEAGATCDLQRSAQATQFCSEVVRCGDDQGFELVDGRGGRVPGALSGGQQHAHGVALSAFARLDDVLGGQGLAGCADGVEHVCLTAAPNGWALGTADFDDAFSGVLEEVGEVGAEAAGSFECRDCKSFGSVP